VALMLILIATQLTWRGLSSTLIVMSALAKVLRVLCVLVLAGAVGVLIGWMKSRDGDIKPIAVPPSSDQPAIDIAPVAMASVAPPPAARANSHRVGQDKPVLLGPPPDESMDWEKQLDDVLLSDTDANNKADRILAMIPTAPSNAQVELSQHLVNMVQDDHYDGAAQLLTNPVTPAAVSTVLMNDLLNRNNTLKLPMLLSVARDDDHPLKDQAREMLELLIQEDNGTNWDQWGTSIDTWLQNNPQ
jgi:hypothetical protein